MSLFRVYFYLSILMLLINCAVWSPESLSDEFLKSGNNFIIDPDNLIKNPTFYDQISDKYLNTNSILSQFNPRILFISKISGEYSKDLDLFGKKLIEQIKNQKRSMESIFFIIFVSNQNILILYPTEDILKYISRDELESFRYLIQNIKFRNNLENVSYIFLDDFIKKLTTQEKRNEANNLTVDHIAKYSSLLEFLYTILYIVIFLGVLLLFLIKTDFFKNQFKNFNFIRADKNCSICLDEIKEKGARENFLLYEEICRKNLNRKNYIAVLSCGHVFHGLCIHLWEEERKNQGDLFLKCPQCRRINITNFNITSNSLENVINIEQIFSNFDVNQLISDIMSGNLSLAESEVLYRQQLEQLENILTNLINSVANLRNTERRRVRQINFNLH
jgi:hypothetical protein